MSSIKENEFIFKEESMGMTVNTLQMKTDYPTQDASRRADIKKTLKLFKF